MGVKMNLVITGGTGFIGRALIAELSKNYNVYNLGRNINPYTQNIFWDLGEPIMAYELPESIDYVIHSAAITGKQNRSNKDYIDINAAATLRLLNICLKKGVKQYIYISSGGVYGYQDKMMVEDDKCDPQDIYAISKYAGECVCHEYANDIKISILRLFFPYGISQDNRLIPNLINQINKGEKLFLNNSGYPVINPVYIDDVIKMIVGVVKNKLDGVYNISGNESISILKLTELIAKKLGNKKLNIEYTNRFTNNMYGSNEKIKKKLGYELEYSLDRGIEKVVKSICPINKGAFL
jgi:UDP-glucose 4-epimerase